MDDRFKTLMERSVDDAIDIQQSKDGIGQGFIEEASMKLFNMRCQKFMVRYQMDKQNEMMNQGPSTKPGGEFR